MGNVTSSLERCLTGQSVEGCPHCSGTGVCSACKGQGGAVKELQVTRTEWAKNAEERLVQQVTSVLMPENVPCAKCTKETMFLQLNAMNRSASPYAAGSQNTSTSLTRTPKKDKTDDWKGSGKCSYCKGSGSLVKFSSPEARRLAFDEYA
jgi:hypothetical protein